MTRGIVSYGKRLICEMTEKSIGSLPSALKRLRGETIAGT